MDNTENKKAERLVRCLVKSDKMVKSRVASIERKVKHPTVGKYVKRTTSIMFHDEKNETKVGDYVYIQQTKPYSKNKTFRFVKMV